MIVPRVFKSRQRKRKNISIVLSSQKKHKDFSFVLFLFVYMNFVWGDSNSSSVFLRKTASLVKGGGLPLRQLGGIFSKK